MTSSSNTYNVILHLFHLNADGSGSRDIDWNQIYLNINSSPTGLTLPSLIKMFGTDGLLINYKFELRGIITTEQMQCHAKITSSITYEKSCETEGVVLYNFASVEKGNFEIQSTVNVGPLSVNDLMKRIKISIITGSPGCPINWSNCNLFLTVEIIRQQQNIEKFTPLHQSFYTNKPYKYILS